MTSEFVLLHPGPPFNATAVVQLDEGPTVRVRYRDTNGPGKYHCDACGRHAEATCEHERRARVAIQARREAGL